MERMLHISVRRNEPTLERRRLRVGNIDSGEYQNEALQSSSDAGGAYGGTPSESGTFENQPISYEVGSIFFFF